MNNRCPYYISCELEKIDDCRERLHLSKECYQQKGKNVVSLCDKRKKKERDQRKRIEGMLIEYAESLDW